MGHTLTEAEALAQVVHAEEAYMEGADGLPVQDDLDARVAEANATHTEVENEELMEVNSVDNGFGTKTYTGGNVVAFAEDLDPNDFQSLVRDALDADQIFHKGGEVHNFEDGSDLVDHLDPMFLAEAAKMTGEKPF